MEEQNDFYRQIGQILVGEMDKENIHWTKIVFEYEVSENYCSYGGLLYTNDKNEESRLEDLDIPDIIGDVIIELYKYTKDNNFTPYNRAIFTLESNGNFNMDFKWEQELQDKWDGKK